MNTASAWILVTATVLNLGQVDSTALSSASDEIERAIHELGADKFETRQQAMERLWALGEAAVPALRAAAQDKSAEVRYRSRFVLDNLQMGITADSPRGILREVHRFRTEGLEDRRRAMHYLETAARPRVILTLLRTEADDRLREEWYLSLERSTIRAIREGKYEEVADALRSASDHEGWMRHFAAFAVQRGTTAAELALLDQSGSGSDQESARKRAYLYRASGELSEACRHAEKVSEEFLVTLLAERRDFVELSRRVAKRLPEDLSQAGDDVAMLGLGAAYARRAGDSVQENRCLDALRFHGERISDQIQKLNGPQQQQRAELIERKWQFAKALLLNGHLDEALAMMRQDRPLLVFEILCEQHHYREAFEMMGVEYPNGFDESWFRQLSVESTEDVRAMEFRYPAAQLVLRYWYFFGRGEESEKYLLILLDAARTDRATARLRILCETAVRLSLRERALEIAELVLDKEDRPNVLGILYPSRGNTATIWWEHFRERHSREKVRQTLERVESVMIPRRMPEEGGEFEKLALDVAASIPNLLEARRGEWWHELAETCLLHGRRDLAMSYFERAAAYSAADATKLGDLLAAGKQWEQAAQWYRKAWNFDETRALPYYLHARALIEVGQETEGTELAERALLMPLANSDLRHELATGMKERGYRLEAKQQFELLLATGYPQTDKSIDAAKQVGNLIYTQEELHAADCWETMLFCCMKPTWRFIETAGYVQIPFLVHKTRARGLLKAARWQEGVREAWSAQAISPGNLELAEELVPLLDAGKQGEDAERLFATSASGLAQLCREFPQCATFHNNLAWLSARCGRQLDVALEHANRAVQLDGKKAGYVDTLAEVHFRRGEVERAIKLAERCLEMEPANASYQRQLERFRAKP